MSMNNNPIDQDPIDHIEETAANRIGSRIREIRLARGLTQAELGDKVGLTADRIRQYEAGYRKPKTDTIKSIASALEVQPLAMIDPVSTEYLGAVYALFELEKLYDLSLVHENGIYSLQFKSERAQALIKYLKVWYSALDIYKTRLSQAHNTEEAEAELKRYNLFKWSLPMVPADEDATSMQIKMYDELIDELREKLRIVELRAQGEHEKPSS